MLIRGCSLVALLNRQDTSVVPWYLCANSERKEMAMIQRSEVVRCYVSHFLPTRRLCIKVRQICSHPKLMGNLFS
jgi:hypothetical protein